MSTRSQIEFQQTWKDDKKKMRTERRTVYRHSDGYPDGECGVIADLKKFLQWNKGRNTDVEYCTANFIYWSKRRVEESYWGPKGVTAPDGGTNMEDTRLKWSDNGPTNCSMLHTGFGVCENDEIHGDTAYFYVVNMKSDTEGTIRVYNHGARNLKLKNRKKIRPMMVVKIKLKEQPDGQVLQY